MDAGGTSKGGYFLAEDLSADRDGFLLRAFGAVERQIDGMGGADPLTSKAAVVRKSLRAADMGISGYESRAELEANAGLRARLEEVRLAAGPLMNLGDVAGKTVPKMSMVSAPRVGGAINTRTFIPHRCHASIGVLGAVSVATACLLKRLGGGGICSSG